MTETEKEKIIEVKNLTAGYGGESVIDDISFDVKKGEVFVVLGESGCGKSTLFKHMIGLLKPMAGEILFEGSDMVKAEGKERLELLNRIGVMYQSGALFGSMTLLENIMLPLIYAGYGKARRLEKATSVIEEVKLTDRMTHKPNELSGGQRQRVAIARALVNNPAIILADEPTGNLDSKTSIEILGLLEEIHRKGNTVIIVTHEEDIALHTHRIIRLIDGKISSDEPNKHIKTIADYQFA